MAELIHTTYRDGDGTLQRTRSWTINIWHASNVLCDCQRKDERSLQGIKHRYRVDVLPENWSRRGESRLG
jgi:hypothetical protein